jgi:hypothetical protein
MGTMFYFYFTILLNTEPKVSFFSSSCISSLSLRNP